MQARVRFRTQAGLVDRTRLLEGARALAIAVTTCPYPGPDGRRTGVADARSRVPHTRGALMARGTNHAAVRPFTSTAGRRVRVGSRSPPHGHVVASRRASP
jgi:hypothetical protein